MLNSRMEKYFYHKKLHALYDKYWRHEVVNDRSPVMYEQWLEMQMNIVAQIAYGALDIANSQIQDQSIVDATNIVEKFKAD